MRGGSSYDIWDGTPDPKDFLIIAIGFAIFLVFVAVRACIRSIAKARRDRASGTSASPSPQLQARDGPKKIAASRADDHAKTKPQRAPLNFRTLSEHAFSVALYVGIWGAAIWILAKS
ncbi:MAG: hypothetical protein ING19_12785 [Azospirillum sp.]|nr:hypothetical protein [Azospirillum sp.]MCZ8123609.1 hypothetical protein [Magnetospirillum sp.]